jgi:hypothetical protein
VLAHAAHTLSCCTQPIHLTAPCSFAALLRSIYEFLDQWGIINFMAQDNPPDYHLRPAPKAPDGFNMNMTNLPAGPGGLYQFRVPSTKEAAAAARSTPGNLSLLTRKDTRGRWGGDVSSRENGSP